MTEGQKYLLDKFEKKFRALLILIDNQKNEIAALNVQLREAEDRTQQALEQVKSLSAKYNNLLTVRAASIRNDDAKSARKQLLNMVREIDTCIALLNG